MNFSALSQPLLIIAAALAGLGLGRVTVLGAIAGHLIEPALIALLYFVFLSVDGGQLRAAFRNVRFTTAAAAVNFLWTPVFAYVLGCLFFRESIDMQIGLMMLLVTPCTDWYLVFTALARGNAALGASILPLNLALQVLLLPAYLTVFYGDTMEVAGSSLLLSIALVLALPLGLSSLTKIWARGRRGADRPSPHRCCRHVRRGGSSLFRASDSACGDAPRHAAFLLRQLCSRWAHRQAARLCGQRSDSAHIYHARAQLSAGSCVCRSGIPRPPAHRPRPHHRPPDRAPCAHPNRAGAAAAGKRMKEYMDLPCGVGADGIRRAAHE